MPPLPFKSQTIAVILAVWCAVALMLGAMGVTATLKPPLPQVILAGLVAMLLAAYRVSAGFRLWIHSIPVAWLVAMHLVRFVGAYFLVLYSRGELPFAFAVPGGIGDIAVATLALLLLVTRTHSRAFHLAWNCLGSVDILFVVFTAARLALQNPESMAALLRLPLCLLPTFIVPLIIFSHGMIFVRLISPRRV